MYAKVASVASVTARSPANAKVDDELSGEPVNLTENRQEVEKITANGKKYTEKIGD